MHPVRPLFAAATASLALAGAAMAAPLPSAVGADQINGGFQAMRDFNLIVLKDLQSTSEVQGRTFVGGNLKGGSSSNYLTSPGAQGTGGVALTVGGNVTGGAKNINNGGSLKVGGNLDSGANMNGGGSVTVDGNVKKVNANGASVYAGGNVEGTNAKDIYYGGSIKTSNGTKHAGDKSADGLQAAIEEQAAIYEQELQATSNYLAELDATSIMTTTSQQAIFNPGLGSGAAIFSISDLKGQLTGKSQLIVEAPESYDLIVINVAGAKVSLPSSINFNSSANLGQKVIWNFFEATSIDLGSKSWYGSVLAPKADLKIGNFIQGSVVARSLVQNGAIKMDNYRSSVTVAEFAGGVPEPATWAMMILGFGAIGAVIRRRRAALA
ncbi:collagen-binding domain-containing protein [Phenylobacterium sp.]|uniref:collagen-binding domain-containing protein n=1 Tax=Phenylobacterium sp. TaxID=1871053 RepID=UPI003D2C72A3